MDYETGWHPGVLAFNDNSTLRGEINYQQKHEKVVLLNKGQKKSYSASQIKFFQFYDKKEGYNRAFFSLTSNIGTKKPSTGMYEIVLEGAMPYYRKPYLTEKLVIKHNKTTSDHIMADFVEYDYFIKTKNGLVKAVNFGDDILPHMSKHMNTISDFIVTNKLDINLIADQIQIVDHYNGLENQH